MKSAHEIVMQTPHLAACKCGGWSFVVRPESDVMMQEEFAEHKMEAMRARSKAMRMHGYQVFGASVGAKKVTRRTLDRRYGRHRSLPLVVTMLEGDLIEMRPLKSPIKHTLDIFDVYQFALEREANAKRVQRLKARKVKRQARLERDRIKAAEDRLRPKQC